MKSSKLFFLPNSAQRSAADTLSNLKAEKKFRRNWRKKNSFRSRIPNFSAQWTLQTWAPSVTAPENSPTVTLGTAGNLRPFPPIPAFLVLSQNLLGVGEQRRHQQHLWTVLQPVGKPFLLDLPGIAFSFNFCQKHHPWSKVWAEALLSYKSYVKLSTQSFSALQSSRNLSSCQTSSFPIPFYFIRISALRPGHPEAAGQGGGKVVVAPLGLSVIPIKLDFVEVGNSSSAVWQQYL